MRAASLVGVLLVGVLILPAATAAQGEHKLQLSFSNGNVTLVAQNVTLREILAEWSRQGGCQFVNADKLAGGPVPLLQFENQPEATVIESLLRPFPGYILAPRRIGTGASQFEAVLIVATSHPSAASALPVAVPLTSPYAPTPDDEIPPVTPLPGQQPIAKNPGNASGATGPTVLGVPGNGVMTPPVGTRPGGGGAVPPGTTGRGGGGGGGR